MNFRVVDRKALTRTAASPYIEASGWFVRCCGRRHRRSHRCLLVVVGRWGKVVTLSMRRSMRSEKMVGTLSQSIKKGEVVTLSY